MQSDLFLDAAGVDLDGVPSLADGADLATGLLGRLEVLEARVADLKAWLLAEAAKGSRLGGAVAAVDAFNRIASMSSALERESTLAVVASAGEHLIEVDAVPGGARPHVDPNTGSLIDTGDTYVDELPLAAAAIGPALRISDPLARERAWESVRVAQHAPHVHTRHLSGDWGAFHVRAFFDQLDHVQPDVIEAADDEIAAVPGRVGVAWLRARIDRFLRAKGLPTRDQVHARGEGPEARNVRLGPTDLFGMANLNAYLPALRAKGIDQLLTDLAGTAPEGDPRTLEQRRADAFLVCFTGPAALNPAVAGQLGYEEAFVADPRFAATTVDARQQQIAREAWESLRLIGATLGLHFAQAPPIELNVHAPATMLIDLHLAALRLHDTNLAGTNAAPRDALGIRGLRLPDGVPPSRRPTRPLPAPQFAASRRTTRRLRALRSAASRRTTRPLSNTSLAASRSTTRRCPRRSTDPAGASAPRTTLTAHRLAHARTVVPIAVNSICDRTAPGAVAGHGRRRPDAAVPGVVRALHRGLRTRQRRRVGRPAR